METLQLQRMNLKVFVAAKEIARQTVAIGSCPTTQTSTTPP